MASNVCREVDKVREKKRGLAKKVNMTDLKREKLMKKDKQDL